MNAPRDVLLDAIWNLMRDGRWRSVDDVCAARGLTRFDAQKAMDRLLTKYSVTVEAVDGLTCYRLDDPGEAPGPMTMADLAAVENARMRRNLPAVTEGPKKDRKPGRISGAVFEWITENGPATGHAVAEGMGLELDQVGTALKHLAKIGMLERIGWESDKGARPRTVFAVRSEAVCDD